MEANNSENNGNNVVAAGVVSSSNVDVARVETVNNAGVQVNNVDGVEDAVKDQIQSININNAVEEAIPNTKFPEYGELASAKEPPKFTPITNEEIAGLKISQLREYLAKYRDLALAAIHDRDVANRRTDLLAKQVELHSKIADHCRAEMRRMQASTQKAMVDMLLHEKKQLEGTFGMFNTTMSTFNFSLSNMVAGFESSELLVKLARRYTHDMSCSDSVYIVLNTPAACREHPILDDYEYGISIKIIDARLKKYKCSIDFGDDFIAQYPNMTREVSGFDALTEFIDKLMIEAIPAIAEFLKNDANK